MLEKHEISAKATEHGFKDVGGLVEREMQAIRTQLANLSSSSKFDHLQTRDLLMWLSSQRQQPTTSAGFLDAMPVTRRLRPVKRQWASEDYAFVAPETERSQIVPTKKVYWKWSSYSLPIGVLAVETYRGSQADREDPHEADTQQYGVKFSFAPPTWIMDQVVRVSLLVSVSGQRLPQWQFMQSGAMSVLPAQLTDAVAEADLLEVTKIVHSMSVNATYEMVVTAHHSRRSQTEVSVTWKSKGTDCSLADCSRNPIRTSLLYGSHARLASRCVHMGMRKPSALMSRRMVSKGTASAENESVTMANYINSSLKVMKWYPFPDMASYKDPSCHLMLEGGYPVHLSVSLPFPPPKLCIPPTPVGVQIFQRHILPYLAPDDISQMGDCDRWWLSALAHAEPRLGAALNAHLRSFRSEFGRSSAGTYRPAIVDVDYAHTAEEVLDATALDRSVFLSWICLMGTGTMLEPFLMAGVSLRQEVDGVSSYLSLAAQARNLDVFDTLVEAGAHPIDGNDAFLFTLNTPPTLNDRHFMKHLAAAIPPSSKDVPPDYSYLTYYWSAKHKGPLPDHDVTQCLLDHGHASYCRPPWSHRMYLGIEMMNAVLDNNAAFLSLLISKGGSADYASKSVDMHDAFETDEVEEYTVLEEAVRQARPELVRLLLENEDAFENRVESVKSALAMSRRRVASRHPRIVMRSSGSFMDSFVSIEEDEEVHSLLLAAHRESGGSLLLEDAPLLLAQADGATSFSLTRALQSYFFSCAFRSLSSSPRRYYSGCLRAVRITASMSPAELGLVLLGTVLSVRAVVQFQVLHVAVWLFSLPRPPRVLLNVLIVLACVAMWLYYSG